MSVVRQIEPKMVRFLDAKLASNGLAQQVMRERDARSLFALAAGACVGIREKTGHNDGTYVELLQETIGGHDHEPYCMAGIQTWLAYAELKTGQRSPLFASEHCLTVWRETPIIYRAQAVPLPGAIPIWRHDGGDNGHTGCLIEPHAPDFFYAIEANTTGGIDPDGQIVREGDGVYRTKRPFGRVGNMTLLGFLKPF